MRQKQREDCLRSYGRATRLSIDRSRRGTAGAAAFGTAPPRGHRRHSQPLARPAHLQGNSRRVHTQHWPCIAATVASQLPCAQSPPRPSRTSPEPAGAAAPVITPQSVREGLSIASNAQHCLCTCKEQRPVRLQQLLAEAATCSIVQCFSQKVFIRNPRARSFVDGPAATVVKPNRSIRPSFALTRIVTPPFSSPRNEIERSGRSAS